MVPWGGCEQDLLRCGASVLTPAVLAGCWLTKAHGGAHAPGRHFTVKQDEELCKGDGCFLLVDQWLLGGVPSLRLCRAHGPGWSHQSSSRMACARPRTQRDHSLEQL